MAHIGIVVLLLGALITQKFGIDGSMRFEIGQKNNFVTLPNTDLVVYSSFDGDRFSKVYEQEVDFFVQSPKKNPVEIPVIDSVIRITDYKKYAVGSQKVVASEEARHGSALRFQLQNAQANVTQWLMQRKAGAMAAYDLGPAQVYLGSEPPEKNGDNAIYLMLDPKTQKLKYSIIYKDADKKMKTGFVQEGDSLDTGWMGLQFRVLKFHARAKEEWDFKELERPTPLTTPIIQVEFQGQKSWIQLNDVLKLFTDNEVYLVSYGNRRVDIGFDLTLKKFNIGRYQGTMRAAAYESLVEVPGVGESLISMNEPLKHNGFTFYQASFQENEMGQPIASILSVNQDPGRFLKYLGSLIMTIGVIMLFYFKRFYIKKT